MTMADGQGLREPRRSGLLLWLVLGAVWLGTAPWRPLLDPDEGRYAEIPREMLAQGDWVTPRLNGLKYFEKPPLQYWATAATYSLFGIREWTARLWSVGLGFLCLPLVFGWTARLQGREAGAAAVLALGVSPYFEIIGHLNLLDAGFAFWMAGTVYAFTLAQSAVPGSEAERRWMLIAWVGAAFAVLTKGIVVGVLAGGSLVAYSVLERDARPWRRLHAPWGLPLFLLVSAPWFLLVSARNPSFAQFFFVHEHFARFLTTVHQRTEPWWYFLVILLVGALPWLPMLPPAVRNGWLDSGLSSGFKPLKFLLIFASITLVFFSLSGSKLAPYILPMMPALASLVGICAARRAHFVRHAAALAGVLMLVLSVAFIVYATRRHGTLPPAVLPWILAGAAAGVAGAIAAWRYAPGGSLRPVWIAVACSALAWQGALCAFAELPGRSARQLLLPIQSLIHPETQLFTIGQYRETLSPYLKRTLTPVDFRGELEFGLREEPQKGLTGEQFLARWNTAADAVAFLDPRALPAWRERGLTGRIIGTDGNTVAVSRP